MSPVTGHGQPLNGATPFYGTIGMLTEAGEITVKLRCRASEREEVEQIIRSVHPYKEFALFFIPLLD